MTLGIFIDNNQILSGNLFNIGGVIFIVFILVLAVIVYIWKRLRRNEKLKYEFITIIAHKFRTPLTYVKWICDSLLPEETDSFKKKSLESIAASNQKLIDLTGTLIEIADSDNKDSAGYVTEKIPLCDLVRNVSNVYKEFFHEKNIFFSSKCPDENILVKADRTRLEFVLQILLENARIYTPVGRNVNLEVAQSFGKAKIRVADDGIGISSEDMPYIFTKFYRGGNAKDNDTEGFGVGLYLAKSIVKRFGGKIEAYSAGLNKGSTFTVVLPITK